MVQKSSGRRGRPRAYDPDTALARAMAAFWDAGYNATSLDVLSAGTGMNRPSLYAAFGDKRAVYQRTLDAYRARAREGLAATLRNDRPLAQALRDLYELALTLYLTGEQGQRGCYLIGTALTEAVRDAAAREAVAGTLLEIDAALAARFYFACTQGELLPGGSPAALAKVAGAVLHSLAVRARAGEPETSLRALVDAAVALICGTDAQPESSPACRNSPASLTARSRRTRRAG